jgi:hypothetical protein
MGNMRTDGKLAHFSPRTNEELLEPHPSVPKLLNFRIAMSDGLPGKGLDGESPPSHIHNGDLVRFVRLARRVARLALETISLG